MDAHSVNTWRWMILIAAVAAAVAIAGVIAYYRDNRRRGVRAPFWSPRLPGLGLLDLWLWTTVAALIIPSELRYVIIPGVFVGGLIAAVFKYALVLKDCMRSDWDRAKWLGQVWYFGEVALFVFSSVYGILVVRSRGLIFEMLAPVVIAGLLAPLFVRWAYIRYQAELEYERTYYQKSVS
jgi:hypothetical protein